MALRVTHLPLSRHICQKSSAIHQGLPAVFVSSDEKLADGIHAQFLCGIALGMEPEYNETPEISLEPSTEPRTSGEDIEPNPAKSEIEIPLYVFHNGTFLGSYENGIWYSEHFVDIVSKKTGRMHTFEEILVQDNYYIFNEEEFVGFASQLVHYEDDGSESELKTTYCLPVREYKHSGPIGNQIYTKWLFTVGLTEHILADIDSDLPEFVLSTNINPYACEQPVEDIVTEADHLAIHNLLQEQGYTELNMIEILDVHGIDVDGDAVLEQLFRINYTAENYSIGILVIKKGQSFKQVFTSSEERNFSFAKLTSFPNVRSFYLNSDDIPELFLVCDVPTGRGEIVFTYLDGLLQPVLQPTINN